MSEDSKELRIVPNKEELAKWGSEGILASISNLPTAYTDITLYSLGVGSAFVLKRIGEWCEEGFKFMKSEKAKEEEEARSEYAKFFETLRFIAKEQITDENLLNAFIHLHILSLSKEVETEEAIEISIQIDTLRRLKGEEILTLLTAYKIGKKIYSKEEIEDFSKDYDKAARDGNANAWSMIITRACHYSTSDYVLKQQEHLEELRLIFPRQQYQVGRMSSEYSPAGTFRLTESGVRLSEFILRGEEILNTFKV